MDHWALILHYHTGFKMKIKLFILFFFVCNLNSFAQFGYAYGNKGYNYGVSLCTTSFDSGYFLLGNSGWYSNGNLDFFLLKSDSAGKIKWAKNYGTQAIEKANDIINLGDTAFYLSGFTNNSSTGDYNFNLIKIDTAGNILFEKQLGTDSWDFCNKAILTEDTMLLMAGQSFDKTNFNGDAYLVKTNLNGDTIKTRWWGNQKEDNFNYVNCNKGFISACGYTNTNQNIKQALIVKYDLHLNPIDTFMFNHQLDCEFYSARLLNNKTTYALGYIKSIANNFYHGFRCLLDSNYNVIWTDTTTKVTDVYWKESIVNSKNEIMTIGGTKLYGNGNYGFYDIHVILFDSTLNYVSSKTYGGVYEDTPSQTIAINDTLFALVGSTNNFGPAYSHLFFLKFNTKNYFINPESFLISTENKVKNEISFMPNPASDFITFSNICNDGKVEILNINGVIITEKQISKQQSKINIKELQAGCYIIKLTLNSQVSFFKVIKQ